MNEKLMWLISVFGIVALVGAFLRMKLGFGAFNLRVVGIILVGTFSALLSLQGGESRTAGIGILGAIAGYLLGNKEK